MKAFLTTQFLRFLMFSGIAAATSLAVGYVLYGVVGLQGRWQYAVAVGIAFLAGLGVGFTLNRRFTFAPSGRPLQDELLRFTLVAMGGLVLTIGLSSVFRAGLRAVWSMVPALAEQLPAAVTPAMIAHLAAVGAVAFYSFIGHKLISFGRKGSAQLHQPAVREGAQREKGGGDGSSCATAKRLIIRQRG